MAPVTDMRNLPGLGAQAANNAAVWSAGDYLAHYDNFHLAPAEVILLARYREHLTGRLLEVGCGGGRVLRYLDLLGGELHGIDISDRMIAHCRSLFPSADIHRGDLRNLRATEQGPFDAILIPDNTLDVFGHEERCSVMRDVRSLLAPDGIFIFSTHNLDAAGHGDRKPRSLEEALRNVVSFGRIVVRGMDGGRMRSLLAPTRTPGNHRRLASLEMRGEGYAIINNGAHHSSLLHYFSGAVAQRRLLAVMGFDAVEVLELDGRRVPVDRPGESFWLHYVARPSAR